jgi:hypothetical protein
MIRLNYYTPPAGGMLGDIVVKKVNVGTSAPKISNGLLLQIDSDGSLCCELGMWSRY